MGLETITNLAKRVEWEAITNEANTKLKDQKYSLEFSSFKNDGTYSKAKTPFPGIYFVFGQDSTRRWVELELKPRTVNGSKEKQMELYESIKSKFDTSAVKTSHPLTFNDQDVLGSPRRTTGKDIRIKMYLRENGNSDWAEAMIEFVNIFMPVLNEIKH